jgi:hypothetical protein
MRAMGLRLSEPAGSRARSASAGDAPASFQPSIRGLCFAPADQHSSVRREVGELGYLVIDVAPPTASERGRLREAIDCAVEDALLALGAPALGPCASSDEDDAFSLQLRRARQAGKEGIALFVGSMRRMTDRRGALDARDGETLQLLAAATVRRPFAVLLEAGDEALHVYTDPVPLASLLGRSAAPEEAVEEHDLREPEFDEPEDAVTDAIPAVQLPADEDDKSEAWRSWAMALGALRGPMSLSSFERTFTESYMPLARAVSQGLNDPRALAVAGDFRRNFARAYTEAFSTFPLTGKRPKMVLDAPDLASRLARTHGARSSLLMVDAMRWDLSLLVRRELGRLIPPRGTLVDAMCLFAALPTTTRRQLEGIARGIDAYRGPYSMEPDSEPPIGTRKGAAVRIVRTGARDLRCLEQVEDRLRLAGTHAIDEFPSIARDVASAISQYASQITHRTLLFVFADHGFTIDAMGAAHHGGASPEEVLVPAFAILLDELN